MALVSRQYLKKQSQTASFPAKTVIILTIGQDWLET
jgi:hypothetical protein